MVETERCLIALGGNCGDVAQTFSAVLGELANHSEINDLRASACYRTTPMGSNVGGEFLNAAATFDTTIEPHSLLDVLQQLEAGHGRDVEHARWSPRTIDLDLIYHGNRIIQDERLTLPHPARWHRRFVLDPACEIAADFVDPVAEISIRDLRARLLVRPLPVAMDEQHAAAISEEQRSQIRIVGVTGGEGGVLSLQGEIDAAAVLTAALDEPRKAFSIADFE